MERLRTYHGVVFQLPAHLDRWQRTVTAIGIESLPLPSAIPVLIEELIGRNQAFVDQVGDFGITMFATPGVRGSGQPTFALHLNRIDHRLNDRRRKRGQRLIATSVAAPQPDCWPRSIKVRSRLHYFLADQIAGQRSAAALGLLVDGDGTVTDTSIANVAIVESGKIVSPPRVRILRGVTQQVVEHLARDSDLDWTESEISTDRLAQADEVLLMGTDGGLWFASRVDRRLIGAGKPGKVYIQLLARFDQHVAAV